jgi:hypothetical protein
MGYRSNFYGVTIECDLNESEISSIHSLWREIREEPEWYDKTWSQFKEELGLSFVRAEIPNWTIINKEKWLWAKIKYGI